MYHYYGPYCADVIKLLNDLVLEGVIAEGYDPSAGQYVYVFLGGNYDESVDIFVKPVIEKYSNLSGEELKKPSYKVLDGMGLEAGDETVFA